MVPKTTLDAAPARASDDLRCSDCGATQFDRDAQRGEVVCKACGLVAQDRLIDPGPEWRAFDSEQQARRARTGAPATFLLHDKGLATEVGWGFKDSAGKRVPSKNIAQLYRLRKWNRRIRAGSSGERSLALALGELDRAGSRIGLPRNVRETAALIYRRAAAKQLVRGHSIEAVAAASLYAACRQCNVPRPLDEIAEATRLKRKVLGRTYRLLARALHLGLAPAAPQSYLAQFAGKLAVGPETEAVARDLLKAAQESGLANGKGPAGLAAAALYVAGLLTNDHRTQSEVGIAAGVTEVTIRNRYQEFAQRLAVPSRVAARHPAGLQAALKPSLRDAQRHAQN